MFIVLEPTLVPNTRGRGKWRIHLQKRRINLSCPDCGHQLQPAIWNGGAIVECMSGCGEKFV